MNDDLALMWERVLSGRQTEDDVALWRHLQSSQEQTVQELLATVRMHRLLTVALAGQSGPTVARHAIELAAKARPVQRQRAVGATMDRLRKRGLGQRGLGQRGLGQRGLGRHRWRRYALMAATVLVVGLAAGLTVAAMGPPVVPALIVTTAPAAGTICDPQGQPLAGKVIPVGGSLRGSGSWELSSPDDRVTLNVSGASRLAMIDVTTVRLDQGELSVSVTSGGPVPWRFVTPHVEARIIGTRFTLTVTDSATKLTVAAGIVSFLPTGATGGEAFPVAAGSSSLAETPSQCLWPTANLSQAVPDQSVGAERIMPGPDHRSGFRGEVLGGGRGPEKWQ